MTTAEIRDGFRQILRTPLELATWGFLTPSWLLIALLAAMMFTPPALPQPPPVDRALFALFVAVGGMYLLFRPASVNWREPLIWALLALAAMALISVLGRPRGHATWSLLASKYVIPLAVFVISACVLRYQPALRRVFLFLLCVQTYLVVVSLLGVLDLGALVFPKYITNLNLGTHSSRARGPFLQAVANGTTLTILGLCVLYMYLKGIYRRWSLVILALTPLAVLATMTRGVWLAFVAAVFVLWGSRTADYRLRVVTFLFAVAAAAAAAGALTVPDIADRVFIRAGTEETVDVRIGLYQGSLDMIRERPWFGRGLNTVAQQIGPYLVPYGLNPDVISPHNTYLEVLVEQGAVGFLLYLVVFGRLFFLGRGLNSVPLQDEDVIDLRFLAFWRAALVAYLVNGLFVVMTYDFINALLFMLAGAVAGVEWRARSTNRPARAFLRGVQVIPTRERAIETGADVR